MNLLPKSHKEFSETEYWNRFFKQRGRKNFDWYGEYIELSELIHKYVKSSDEILMVGCGNSSLSASLYDVGIRKIVNIDISAVVIKQMISIHCKQRPGMKFLEMDATRMNFSDGEFSVILDKGTLDALMPDNSPETMEIVKKYWSEIGRVLRLGGRYICISLLQQHILEAVVEYFSAENFILRVNRCHEAEKKTAENSKDGTALPVFMIIATKFKPMPQKLLELSLSSDVGTIQRVHNTSDFIESIRSAQKAAMVISGLHKLSLVDQNEVSLDLYQQGQEEPRYTIYVLDQRGSLGSGKFASFIVPQGRENEWLFFTPEGRRRLLQTVRYNRLAIVTMHRGQDYKSWDDVKSELSANIQSLAPADLRPDEIIPYLSLGAELGTRELIHSGKSECSGEYIIEDVAGDNNKILRKLIFLSNQFVIQSEAQVKIVKRGKNKIKVIDRSYLGCQHHLFMTMGVHMSNKLLSKNKTNKKKHLNTLLIGLGGGGLCVFMQQCIKNSKITAVEIDPEMHQVATKFFGLQESENLKVVIEDGLIFLRDSSTSEDVYDAILFDVDGKDSSVGMSCPPINFVSEETLSHVSKCIGAHGLFILNLVSRDEKIRQEVIDRLKCTFKSIFHYKLELDLNEIIYCSNDTITEQHFKNIAIDVSQEIAEISTKEKLEFDHEFFEEDSFSKGLAPL